MSKPIFDFKGYSIRNLVYRKDKSTTEILDPDDGFNFETTLGFSDDYTLGMVSLSIELKDNADEKEDEVFLSLEIEGMFHIDESIFIVEETGEKRELSEVQNIFLVNATAILYPYLRSIVSMITSLDAKSNMVLPVIDIRRLNPQKIE
jgi:preprotein translocase subunit SecB